MQAVYLFSIFSIISLLSALDFGKCLVETEKNWNRINHFSALFYAKELIGNKIVEQKDTELKFAKPLKVYMKWTEGDSKGQEIIYNPEKYGRKLKVHGGGWKNLINLSLDPKGSQATKTARHTIYESGIGHIINLVKTNYDLTLKTGKGKINFVREEEFDSRKTYLFVADLPADAGFYAPKIYINLDAENKLPVKITVYGSKNEFLESYAYTNLNLNAKISDMDFDIKNSEYNY